MKRLIYLSICTELEVHFGFGEWKWEMSNTVIFTQFAAHSTFLNCQSRFSRWKMQLIWRPLIVIGKINSRGTKKVCVECHNCHSSKSFGILSGLGLGGRRWRITSRKTCLCCGNVPFVDLLHYVRLSFRTFRMLINVYVSVQLSAIVGNFNSLCVQNRVLDYSIVRKLSAHYVNCIAHTYRCSPLFCGSSQFDSLVQPH